ncbi:MAG: hypothetical protein ACE5FI_18355 [Anaerolineales bacterium]
MRNLTALRARRSYYRKLGLIEPVPPHPIGNCPGCGRPLTITATIMAASPDESMVVCDSPGDAGAPSRAADPEGGQP